MVDREKASPRSLGVIVGIAVLLSIALELLFVRVSAPKTAYETLSTADTAYSAWEFDKTGDHAYYALAYNSYFSYDGFGGVPARSLRVYLERDSADVTETVLYYTAVVDGTEGEYIAPLAKQDDGSYLAEFRADALYSVKIYPTESVRTTVTFRGTELNSGLAAETFRPARMLLWIFLLLSAYTVFRLLAAGRARRKQRAAADGKDAPASPDSAAKAPAAETAQPAVDAAAAQTVPDAAQAPAADAAPDGALSPWLSVYVFLQTLLLLAVFGACRLYTAVAGLETPLLLGALGVFSALYFVVWLVACRLRDAALKCAVCALAAGALFVFASAPLQAPDETSHFLRAYAISRGEFTFDTGYRFPDDVQWLVRDVQGNLKKSQVEFGGPGALQSLRNYFADRDTSYTGDPVSTPSQLILPYLPAALGIALARLAGGDALVCFWAGRLMNVLMLACCTYFSLRLATRWRGALILLSLLPLTSFLAASYSYDSLLLSCLLLLFGAVFSAQFSRREAVIFALSFAVIVMLKWLYAPLLLTLLLVPRENFRLGRLPRWALLLGAGALAFLFYEGSMLYAALLSNVPPTIYPAGVNIAAQARYILANPLRYLLTAAVDGYQNLFYWNASGLFGWLDADARLTDLLVPVLFLACCGLYGGDAAGRKKGDLWLSAGLSLLLYGLVVTGFYCTWSTLGSTSILGVQARYFLPAVPLVFLLVSSACGRAVRFTAPAGAKDAAAARDALCIFLCFGAAVLAAAELSLVYYFT